MNPNNRHPDTCRAYNSTSKHPTCIWLKDGTKIVIKREGHAAWLEVVDQAIITPCGDPSLNPTPDAPHGYCADCREPLDVHCENCQGMPYKPVHIRMDQERAAASSDQSGKGGV